MPDTQAQPSDIAAEKGTVTMDGPGGVALTLTPDAADQTADRLKDAAKQARQESEPD